MQKLEREFIPLRKQAEQSNSSNSQTNSGVPDVEVEQFRNRNGIEVDGDNIPRPIRSFQEIGLPTRFVHFLFNEKKYYQPTAIQMQAIGCLLQDRDVICLSPTGSGKTYGYLLPMCNRLWRNTNVQSTLSGKVVAVPSCLVLVPTRELMNQVFSAAKELVNVLEFKNLNHPSGILSRSHRLNDFGGHTAASYREYSDITSNSNLGYHPRGRCDFPPFSSSTNSVSLNIQASRINEFSNTFNHAPPFLNAQTLNLHTSHRYVYQTPPYGVPYNHDFSPRLQNPFERNNVDQCSQHHFQQPETNKHTVVGVCGGAPIKENLQMLSGHTRVLIATPGRLLDLCNREYISLENVRYFVIDECDKMLDIGQEELLRKIVAMVTVHNSNTQTSLWSATLPESLERLARSAVVHPVYVCTGVKDTVPSNITQKVMFMHTYLKPKMLLDVLRQTPYPPVIIFTSYKQRADELAELLEEEQFCVAAIHSEKDQTYRNDVISSFRNDELDILVATDLISRGLDIPIVTHVINYDTPNNIEDYVHRCGRTGRFGRSGLATTFLTLDCKIAKDLKEMLESTNNEIPPELSDSKLFGKKVLTTDMGDRIV